MPDSFTCPECGAVSYHPQDIAEEYCGNCHIYTGSMAPELCLYCKGQDPECGFCENGKPLDTQENWDKSWGAIPDLIVELPYCPPLPHEPVNHGSVYVAAMCTCACHGPRRRRG